MSYYNVKITDLLSADQLLPDHQFLVATPLVDLIDSDTPYTSNSINGKTLSTSLANLIEYHFSNVKGLSINTDWIINGEFKFNGRMNGNALSDGYSPEDNTLKQNVQINPSEFLNALLDPEKLSSILSSSETGIGWYGDRKETVLQGNDTGREPERTDYQYSIGTDTTLGLKNSVVANIDFVERAIAGAYELVINHIKNLIPSLPDKDSKFIPSHIGEIVHTTTLGPDAAVQADNGEVIRESSSGRGDAAMRKKYGYGQTINGITYPDTEWILHSGYFLRGASSGVDIATARTNGGADTISRSLSITQNNIPSHTHTMSSHSHNYDYANKVTGWSVVTAGSEGAHAKVNYLTGKSLSISEKTGSTSSAGGGSTSSWGSSNPSPLTFSFDNKPLYKNVYIWERIK